MDKPANYMVTPVYVEAIQISEDNLEACKAFNPGHTITKDGLEFVGREGWFMAVPGHWIVKFGPRDFCGYADDVFEETFVPKPKKLTISLG